MEEIIRRILEAAATGWAGDQVMERTGLGKRASGILDAIIPPAAASDASAIPQELPPVPVGNPVLPDDKLIPADVVMSPDQEQMVMNRIATEAPERPRVPGRTYLPDIVMEDPRVESNRIRDNVHNFVRQNTVEDTNVKAGNSFFRVDPETLALLDRGEVEAMDVEEARAKIRAHDFMFNKLPKVKEVAEQTGDDTIFDTIGSKIKDYFGNEENMVRLALGFNSMRLEPDAQLAATLGKRLETLASQRGHNATLALWAKSKDPRVKRALEYYNATKDMKGASKIAYGVDTTYGTTPRLIRNPKTGEYRWGVIGSDGSFKEVPIAEGFEIPPNVEKVDAGTYWILMAQDGTPIGTLPKNIAGAAAAKELGKNWAESIGGGQKTIDNLSQGIEAINWVLDPKRRDILDRGFGLTGEYLPTILPETKDLYAKMNQIGAKQFLAGFESLKGGGQISNIEGGQAKQAGLALFDEEGKLKTGISPSYVREQLEKLRDIYQRGIDRAKSGYRIKPGFNPMTDDESDFLVPVNGAQQGIPTAPVPTAPTAPTNPYAGFSIAR